MKSAKSNLFLLVFILILGLAAFVLLKNGQKSSFKEGDFAVTDTASITKIVMTPVENNKGGVPLTLEKETEGKWMLNQKFPVLEPQLHYFFRTLAQLKVKEKFQEKGNESATKALDKFHVNVEVFDGTSRIKSYELGHEFKTHEGSIMRMQNSNTAFVVSIPGYKGYLNARFPMLLDDWKENLVFQAKSEQLVGVSVTHHWKSALSFSFTRENINSEWHLNDKPVEAKISDGYFRNFIGKVYAESLAEAKFPGKKEELAKRPNADIDYTLRYADGTAKTVKLFLREDNKNSFFAWVEGENQLFTVQHFVMDRFLNPGGKEDMTTL